MDGVSGLKSNHGTPPQPLKDCSGLHRVKLVCLEGRGKRWSLQQIHSTAKKDIPTLMQIPDPRVTILVGSIDLHGLLLFVVVKFFFQLENSHNLSRRV